MFWFIFGVVLGLLVGWNLPQPQFVKDLIDKLGEKFPFLARK